MGFRVELNENLIEKYESKPGPYYTGYPTAKVWDEDFGTPGYAQALEQVAAMRPGLPMALYIHFPFCVRLCRFCFCYSTATHDRAKISRFLRALMMELVLIRELCQELGFAPDIREVHLGGGSPSYMTQEEFVLLMDHLRQLTDPRRLEEFTIEIDAITVDRQKLHFYADQGITRISFGIQDLDPGVQKAIGRVQSPQLLADLLDAQTRSRFRSVNFDLMYGLPKQDRDSFRETLAAVKELAPQRVAVYNYFHMPEVYRHQGAIKREDLPSLVEKSQIFVQAAQELTAAGYSFVGIDHFARPDDDLARAQEEKRLCRHFMGYTSGRAPHILGLGPSALGGFSRFYTQNVCSIGEYQKMVAQGRLPLLRGYALGPDDLARRDLINNLLCYFHLELAPYEARHRLDFSRYFAPELEDLEEFARDGLVEMDSRSLTVTNKGRLFTRHICANFDPYLRAASARSPQRYVPAAQRSAASPFPAQGRLAAAATASLEVAAE